MTPVKTAQEAAKVDSQPVAENAVKTAPAKPKKLEFQDILNLVDAARKNGERAVIKGADFTSYKVADRNWSAVDFIECDFTGVDFGAALLQGCTFEGCKLEGAKTEQADLRWSSLWTEPK